VREIFVFGSNLAGIHGAGAALYARNKYGAQMGYGKGPTGNAYAIPTKDFDIVRSLPLTEIRQYIRVFSAYAGERQGFCTFKVTRIGTGYAGYTDDQIAPMFIGSPDNCVFDGEWAKYLPGYNYFEYRP
jgi:hypothetical protein